MIIERGQFAALCPGCFAQKGPANPCPSCGYDEFQSRSTLLLPHRTVLHDKYVIGRVLGSPGGFGITYLAWDIALQSKRAIKEYLPKDIAGRETKRLTVLPYSSHESELFHYGLKQFFNEARTLDRFEHPNIVRVRDFFEGNQTAYLVMAYYAGRSLGDFLRKRGKLPEKNALLLMMPVLDGLRAVHSTGALHRDIKPDNIYLADVQGGSVRPLLLDFGAARQAMGVRTRSLSVIFTPGYAPFEQYFTRGNQCPWTDVYSAAAVLYRMVTGTSPPDANERKTRESLIAPRRFGVSKDLSAALEWGLAREPEARPQSAWYWQQRLLETTGQRRRKSRDHGIIIKNESKNLSNNDPFRRTHPAEGVEEIEIPADYPLKVILESTSGSGSLPPKGAWHNRLTLFGSGELQSCMFKGYMPGYTARKGDEFVDDLESWFEENSFSKLAKHLTLIDGRLSLNKATPLNKLGFSWEDNGETGQAIISRLMLDKAAVTGALSDVYNEGIRDLPTIIGGVPAPGSSCTSIIFACKLNGELFEKNIICHGYNEDEKSTIKFYLIKKGIDEKLNPFMNDHKPWWKIW